MTWPYPHQWLATWKTGQQDSCRDAMRSDSSLRYPCIFEPNDKRTRRQRYALVLLLDQSTSILICGTFCKNNCSSGSGQSTTFDARLLTNCHADKKLPAWPPNLQVRLWNSDGEGHPYSTKQRLVLQCLPRFVGVCAPGPQTAKCQDDVRT